MTELPDFLLRQIAADEKAALEALAHATIYEHPKWHWIVAHSDGSRWCPTTHDPARVLAECAARRAIVELSWHHFGEDDYAWGMEEAKRQILLLLAQPYRGAEGWRDEWEVKA